MEPSLTLVIVRTTDLERARAFYGAIGLGFVEAQHGDGPAHLSSQIGALVLELYPEQEQPDRTQRLGFRVDNQRAVLERLSERGFGDPAWRGPTAIVRDPDGRAVEIEGRPEAYEQWASDAELLARIGKALHGQDAQVEVELPRDLAEAARAAWERDERGKRIEAEDAAERRARRRAGTLGLIGLSLEQRGAEHGSTVRSDLDAWFVGESLEAADDYALLRDESIQRRSES